MIRCFEKLCFDLLEPRTEEPDSVVYHFNDECYFIYFNVAGDLSYEHVANSIISHCLRQFQENRVDYHRSSYMSLATLPSPMDLAMTKHVSNAGIGDKKRPFFTENLGDGPGFRDRDIETMSRSFNKTTFWERSKEQGTILTTLPVDERQPICEAALFVQQWVHRGDLNVSSHSYFLRLSHHHFGVLIENDFNMRELAGVHAVRFARVLNSIDIDASDLMTSSDVLDIILEKGEMSEFQRARAKDPLRSSIRMKGNKISGTMFGSRARTSKWKTVAS